MFFCAYSHIACEQGIDNYSAGVKPGSASTPQLGNKLEVKSGRSGCHKDWGRPIILHLRNTIVLSKLKMAQMHKKKLPTMHGSVCPPAK